MMTKGGIVRKRIFNALAWLLSLVLASSLQLLPLDSPSSFVPSAKAAGEKMLLLWDDVAFGPVPTGWTNVSNGAPYQDKFLRGDAIANVGQNGPASPHNHTSGTVAFVGSTTGVASKGNKADTTASVQNHNHATIDVFTMDSQAILPKRKDLILMECDAGIPATIPQNAIVLYDGTLGSDFVAYNDHADYFIRTAANAGNAQDDGTTHNHTNLTITSGGPDSGTAMANGGSGVTPATGTHTHTYTGTSPESSDDTPLHTEVILARATADPTTVPSGMIAMFDGDPNIDSSSWDTISESGEAFYQVYMEAQTSYQTGQGSATHTHTISTASGGASAFTADVQTGAPSVDLATAHTHTISGNFSTESNEPPYVNVVVAKKLDAFTPESQDWRWYDAEDTTDPANSNGTDTASGDSIANENTTNGSTRIIYNENNLKLRFRITETLNVAQDNVRFRLQYSTSSTFASAVEYVAETGAVAQLWQYYDGAGVDDATIGAARLSGSPSLGTHNESGTAASTFDFPASGNYEFEFTINNNSAPADTTFYFRAYDTVNDKAVPLGSGKTYPYLTTAASYDLEISTTPTTIEYGGDVSTDTVNVTWNIPNTEWGFWDKRGADGKYNVQVSSIAMQHDGSADNIPTSDQYWYSKIAELTGAFDSATTNMTGIESYTALSSTLNAYQDDNTSSTEGNGGFNPSPGSELRNLSLRTAGVYTGTLTLTIVSVP